MTLFTKLTSVFAATAPAFAMVCGLGVATFVTSAATGVESDARSSLEHSRRGARTVVSTASASPALPVTTVDRRGARSIQVYAQSTQPMTAAAPTERVRITARQ